jgi:mannose-6-phosphate isomerase-like protein (cupin superfamily)
MSDRLTSFLLGNEAKPVCFVGTQSVKEGVECDIYAFIDDDARDLAIVRVQKGYRTPLQRIMLGDKTTEGFVSGKGTLTVQSRSGMVKSYVFQSDHSNEAVVVEVGEIMQWYADGDIDLTFYEVCEPPYKDGRFENL